MGDPHMQRAGIAADLATERLSLRPTRPADLPALHRLWTDPDIRRFLFDERVLSRDDARAFVDASVTSFVEHGFGLWLVFRHDAAELAGFAGLLSSAAAPSLIYGIRPELCGCGLATEAARAILDYALGQRLPKVMADVDEPNVASVRVLEKLGMTRVRRGIVNGRPLLYFELTCG